MPSGNPIPQYVNAASGWFGWNGSERRFGSVLAGISVVLLLLSPVSRLIAAAVRGRFAPELSGTIPEFFAIDAEHNLPTAFSVAMMVLAGATFLLVGFKRPIWFLPSIAL